MYKLKSGEIVSGYMMFGYLTGIIVTEYNKVDSCVSDWRFWKSRLENKNYRTNMSGLLKALGGLAWYIMNLSVFIIYVFILYLYICDPSILF